MGKKKDGHGENVFYYRSTSCCIKVYPTLNSGAVDIQHQRNISLEVAAVQVCPQINSSGTNTKYQVNILLKIAAV